MSHARTELADPRELARRRQLLDTTWVLAAISAFGAAFLLWYLRIVATEFAPIAWSSTVFLAATIIAGLAADRAQTLQGLRIWAMSTQLLGLLLLAFVWLQLGGVQQPAFLVFFVVPVIAGSLILNSWQHYLITLLAVVTVAACVHGPAQLAAAVLPAWLLDAGWLQSSSVARAQVPSSAELSMLGLSATSLFAVSATSRFLALHATQLYLRLGHLDDDRLAAEDLLAGLIRQSAVAELLVVAQTGRILHSSRPFDAAFGARESPVGRLWSELVQPAHPEVIDRLIHDGGTTVQSCRTDGGATLFEITVDALPAREPLARLQWRPAQELGARATLDSLDDPVIVIGLNAQVDFANTAARSLFPDAQPGQAAGDALRIADQRQEWWNLGPRTSATRNVRIDGQVYQALIKRKRIADERQSYTLVHLRRAGLGE